MLPQRIISVFKRELHSIISDKVYLAVVVLLPLLMILFFGVMFYRGTIEELPIAVVDRDHSVMSRKLQSMIDATKGAKIAYQPHSMAEAEALMLGGDVVAILYIDDGFEEDIYRGVSTMVECYLLGTNLSTSGVVERDVQQTVETFSAGIALSKLQSMGVGYSQAMADIMPISIDTHIISNPYLNYGYYLAPIFMIMGMVIFTVLSSVYAIGREIRYATAREWLLSARNSLLCGVIGKLLPITLSMFLFSELIYVILFVVMGMECEGSLLYLSVATLILILSYQAVAIAIISVTANMRLGLSLGGGYSVMAFTFSGITFPTIAMFGVARVVSKLFPLTYFSEIFVGQAMRGTSLYIETPKLLFMMLFWVLVPLSWRRLHRVVESEKYWGRE